ncbi:hypothetical protein DFH28DRAFT_1019395 [Melampsora americana]|nr:hypothetical protein DFH28DRAFT_1019395 [Melampsora americana]
MTMRSARMILLSFLILVSVSSLLSLGLEDDLALPLLTVEIHPDHPSNSYKQPKDLYSSQGCSSSSVLSQTKTNNEIRKILGEQLEHLLRSDSSIPKSASERSWKVYYKISPKVLFLHHQIPEINELVQEVSKLGLEFTSKRYTLKELEELIVPSINLAHHALNLDSLGMNERLWVVGVLSCLTSKIPKQKIQMISKLSDHTYQASLRGNLELLLLKDLPLEKALEKMWPDSLGARNHPPYMVREALLRASLVDSILHQIPSSTNPSAELQVILQWFLHLKVPINDSNASKMTEFILIQLKKMNTSPRNPDEFDEGKLMMQVLLHLQGNHLPSKVKFLNIIKDSDIGKSLLEVDMDLQLQDVKPSMKRLYQLLKDIKKIRIEELTSALNQAVYGIHIMPSLGSLLRALDMANRQNPIIYQTMNTLLSGSKKMTAFFANILRHEYPKTNDPNFFRSSGSELLALCSSKRLELLSYKNRKILEDKIISEGLSQKIEPFHQALVWNFKGNRRIELTDYLHTIYAELHSRIKNQAFSVRKDDPMIEYILHLIGIRNQNEDLLRWLTDRNSSIFKWILFNSLFLLEELSKKSSDGNLESEIQFFEKELCSFVKPKLYLMDDQ